MDEYLLRVSSAMISSDYNTLSDQGSCTQTKRTSSGGRGHKQEILRLEGPLFVCLSVSLSITF